MAAAKKDVADEAAHPALSALRLMWQEISKPQPAVAEVVMVHHKTYAALSEYQKGKPHV